MELQLCKDTISSMSVIDTSIVNHEDMGELLIPETYPDAEKILDTYVSVLLKSKEAQQGSVVIKGIFQTTVIYAAEDKNIYKADLPLPYTVTVNKLEIESDSEISAVIRIMNTDAVISNPRKIIVRVDYSADVRVYNKQNIEFCSSIDDDRVFQLKDSVEYTYLNCYYEKTFVVSDDFTLSDAAGGNAEIIGAEYKILNSDYIISGNRLIIRGYGEAELLVLFSDNICPKKITKRIDYSQIIDIEAVETIENIVVKAMLNGCYCDINSYTSDELSVTVEMHAVAQCDIYCRKNVIVLCDAYSTKGVITTTNSECRLMSNEKITTASCKVCERFDNLANIREIVDAKVKILDAAIGEDAVRLKCQLVGYGIDENAVPQTFKHAFTADVGINCKNYLRYSPQVLNIDIFGNEIIFDGEIELKTEHSDFCNIACIDAVEFEPADIWNAAPSAVIYCCKANDTVWGVAKKYLSSAEMIRQVNDMEVSEEITEGKMILIPKM